MNNCLGGVAHKACDNLRLVFVCICATHQVLLDCVSIFTTAQPYVMVGRCESFAGIEIVGKGRWYHLDRGEIVLHEDQIKKDLRQHPRALEWLHQKGYVRNAARYAGVINEALARAEALRQTAAAAGAGLAP